MSEKSIFSLSQVARSIRKTIEQRYTQTYWVKTEMHKMNLFASGHAFPELVEKQDGKVIAQMSGVIWKSNLQRVNQQFLALLNEPIREGGTFLMLVQVQFSETHGVSLNITDIDPNYTLGELQRERKETLLKLENENLLRKNQELPSPFFPKRIAIISAETSKGLSDFMKVIQQNKEQYIFDTFLFNAYLQGEQAVSSIITQLNKINQLTHHFDLIVIVRGGGGEVGMSCYNNYELCKAIATAKLPVFTGIGHSTNFTVAEMIAHHNAITPTELAEGLVSAFRKSDWELQLFQKTIVERSIDQVFNQKERLQKYKRQLIAQSNLILEINKRFQSKASHALIFQSRSALQLNTNLLNINGDKLNRLTQQAFLKQKEQLLKVKEQLQSTSKQFLRIEQMNLSQMSNQVRLLDPKTILSRGYSIVRFNGKTINDENIPIVNETIQIETANFSLETTVIKIEKND